MVHQKKIRALIIEEVQDVIEPIERTLKEKSFTVTTLANKDEALDLLKKNHHQLALIGEAKGSSSVFKVMKKIVMTSPMTSIILISDLPKEEIDEKAEGYGILGHITRSVPSEDLALLLEQFDRIAQSIHPPKT